MKQILVLDFGGSSVKYSVIDEDKNRHSEGSLPAPNASTADFHDAVRKIYETCPEKVDGIAISVPGFINGDTGYMRTAGAYSAMYGQNIYDLLRDITDVPIVAENDGKCAAFAESWIGSLQGVKEGAVVIVGTGLAGGIIHDGKLFRGHSGTAGELSFIGLPASGDLTQSPLMNCSMLGLIITGETVLGIDPTRGDYGPYCQVFHLDTGYRSAMNDDPSFANGLDGKLFFELLDEGHTELQSVYDRFIDSLTTLLMTIQAITDPEMIAIGGGVTRQKRILKDLQEKVDVMNSIMGGSVPQIHICACGAGSSPNEYGAAYNFFKKQGIVD